MRNQVVSKALTRPVPWPKRRIEHVAAIVERLITKAALETTDETALFFSGARLFVPTVTTFCEALDQWWHTQCDCWMETANLYDSVEKAVIDAFGLSPSDSAAIAESRGAVPHLVPRMSAFDRGSRVDISLDGWGAHREGEGSVRRETIHRKEGLLC